MRKPLQVIIKAYDAKRRAQKALLRAVKLAYPIGTTVHWEHGRKEISALVVGHSEWDWVAPDLFVEGRTGKRYSVDAHRVWSYERAHAARAAGGK